MLRVHLCVVGRLRSGPEAELVADYLDRFEKTGRSRGFGPCKLIEVEDRKNLGATQEAVLLGQAIPDASLICVLDERGKTLSSPGFARQLCAWRDQGLRDVSFVIGGADGVAAELRDRADFSLSFGKMVWPHMLARVMLAEQLYRAVTIEAGLPYHRA